MSGNLKTDPMREPVGGRAIVQHAGPVISRLAGGAG